MAGSPERKILITVNRNPEIYGQDPEAEALKAGFNAHFEQQGIAGRVHDLVIGRVTELTIGAETDEAALQRGEEIIEAPGVRNLLANPVSEMPPVVSLKKTATPVKTEEASTKNL